MKNLLQGLVATAVLALALAFATLPALAQTSPGTDPAPTALTNQPPTDDGFTKSMVKLDEALKEVLEVIQETIMKPLLEFFQTIALALGLLVFLVGLVREWRRSTDPINGFFFFLRAVCMFALVFLASKLLVDAQWAGDLIAYGTPTRASVFQYNVAKHQAAFNENYTKFCLNHFTAQGEGEPPGNVVEYEGHWYMGMIKSNETGAKDLGQVADELDPSGWHLGRVLALFHLTRFVMEAGDFFLLIEGNLIFVALALLCPFMVISAIDTEAKSQIAKRYLWGALVFTLAFPTFAQVVRFVAYGAANIIFSLGTDSPSYLWDKQAMAGVGDPGSPAVYLALAGWVVMAFAAIALPATPLLVYSFSMGRVYETAANFGASWFGAAAGFGVSVVSQVAGASLSKAAENLNIQGQADSGTTRAETRRATDNRRAELSAAREHTGVNANRLTALSSAQGEKGNMHEMAELYRAFQLGQLPIQTKKENESVANSTGLTRNQNQAQADNESFKRKVSVAGSLVDIGARLGTGVVTGQSSSMNDSGLGGSVGKAVFPQLMTAPVNQALDTYRDAQTKTNYEYAYGSQGAYLSDETLEKLMHSENPAERRQVGGMFRLINDQQDAFAAAADRKYETVAGGINAAAGMQHRQIDRNLAGEIANNQTIFEGEQKALEQMRQAGEQAVQLRTEAELLRNLGGAAGKLFADLFEQNKIHH
ncbi:MAG: hypothetical protein K1Y36_18680 [Blastocatellia bacterium]|nr:hypothetical protein [Blastocatellia bacterium]